MVRDEVGRQAVDQIRERFRSGSDRNVCSLLDSGVVDNPGTTPAESRQIGFHGDAVQCDCLLDRFHRNWDGSGLDTGAQGDDVRIRG